MEESKFYIVMEGKKMEGKKILLYGHGTFLNRGCEAIIKSTASNIKKLGEKNIVCVATFDYDNDKNQYCEIVDKYLDHNIKGRLNDQEIEEEKDLISKNASLVDQEKLYEKKVLAEIDSTDICISVGGDNYCYDPPVWLYILDDKARKKNKKLVLWGASIGKENLNMDTVKDLKKFDVILMRESLTQKNLEKYIDSDRLLLLPDPAFALDAKETDLTENFKRNDVIGLNISPIITKWGGEQRILDNLEKFINHIFKNYPYSVALIPHSTTKDYNDLEVLRKIKDRFKNNSRIILVDKKVLNCSELKYIISKCRFLIASRTHASIAGYTTGVPTLVLGYSIKSKGIAKDIFGSFENYVLPFEEIDKTKLIEKFEFLVNNEQNIKKILEVKMPVFKKQAGSLYEIVTKKLGELDVKYITRKEKCSGCGACVKVCPEQAITLQPDEEGFLYPFIDLEKCAHCDICRKVCPNNRSYKYKYNDLHAYACKNKSNDERLRSSSGGVFSLLAREILNKGGCVFGAAFDKRIVKHIKIDNEKELIKLRGSKYVQSIIGESYTQAKRELEKEREVLFSGTPCQIEGLKSYLEKDYKKLICVSVVCHGVPNDKIFSSYQKEMEMKYDSKLLGIDFKNKEISWKDYQIKYFFEDKNIKQSIWHDRYMIGYLNNYYLRPSCYDCDFRLHNKNSSDLILGDFWGVGEEIADYDDDKGVSAVLVNSKKGALIFEKIKNKIIQREVNVKKIEKHNLCLVDSVPLNERRFNFFDLFEKNGLVFAVDYFQKEDTLRSMEEQIQKVRYAMQNSVIHKEIDNSSQELKNKYKTLKNELDRIISSRKWKIVTSANSIFNFIFPHGCLRRKFLRIGYKGIMRIFKVV